MRSREVTQVRGWEACSCRVVVSVPERQRCTPGYSNSPLCRPRPREVAAARCYMCQCRVRIGWHPAGSCQLAVCVPLPLALPASRLPSQDQHLTLLCAAWSLVLDRACPRAPVSAQRGRAALPPRASFCLTVQHSHCVYLVGRRNK